MSLFFHQYHRRSADQIAGRNIHPFPPHEQWPKEWKTIYYKTYQGIPIITLPQITSQPANFFDMVTERKSVRGGHKEGVSVQDLSVLLKYSCGLQDIVRGKDEVKFRAQPSGGARFPLEAYILSLKKENGVAPGVYHYNIKKHALDILRVRSFPCEDIAGLFTYPWANDCSMALIITGVFERGAMKYGERAYRYAMLEAGHIGQGVYLAGASRGVGVTGMGGTHDEALHNLLDIDGTQESLVYALMLSK
ncbi:MAG: SagB/ThcOx family dehydrogenase [bacterium]|nr:SagB/ThcOx family dehydrogenase [bacterium]